MENVKRVPYGVSDFVKVVERNQYYVDKTMYLPLLEEEADNLFLFALVVLARAYSSACSMLITTYEPRIGLMRGLVICG